ncbi:MAG: PEP-CTERM sorting domain-containing protein [bacterium]|nr:PEP-CTERM sorting domain-containing protein [bacterium]
MNRLKPLGPSASLVAVISLVAFGAAWCSQAQADFPPDDPPPVWHPDFPDPELPPVHPDPGIAYYGQDLHAMYPQNVIMNDPIHEGFRNIDRVPFGAHELETFDSDLQATVDVPSMSIFGQPVTLTGPVTTQVNNYVGGQMGVFQTEIVSMSLTGSLGGMTFEVRESPSLSSPGRTSIQPDGGGGYQIESFFDVFTELSVNGGPFMAQTTPVGRMRLCPEPTSLGLLALGGLFLARRRR